MSGNFAGRYPAVVKEYDQETRTCRVEIPGLTDGADVLPLAEIEYPIGDKSAAGDYSTELEILEGDTVWIAFIGGDPRFPIITGYRNPQTGNSADWRRIHHANIEQVADETLHLQVGDSDVTMTPEQIVLKIGSSSITMTEDTITLESGRINLN